MRHDNAFILHSTVTNNILLVASLLAPLSPSLLADVLSSDSEFVSFGAVNSKMRSTPLTQPTGIAGNEIMKVETIVKEASLVEPAYHALLDEVRHRAAEPELNLTFYSSLRTSSSTRLLASHPRLVASLLTGFEG